MGLTLNQEQVYRISSSLLVTDIVSYCKTHPMEYEDELKSDYENGNITLQQFEKELETIKALNEEVKNNGIIQRVC